jgi:hypothetical protein
MSAVDSVAVNRVTYCLLMCLLIDSSLMRCVPVSLRANSPSDKSIFTAVSFSRASTSRSVQRGVPPPRASRPPATSRTGSGVMGACCGTTRFVSTWRANQKDRSFAIVVRTFRLFQWLSACKRVTSLSKWK